MKILAANHSLKLSPVKPVRPPLRLRAHSGVAHFTVVRLLCALEIQF